MNMNIRSLFSRPLRDPKNRIGATAVEYMIMLILVALFVMGIVRVFGNAISEKVSYANSGIETMADRPSGREGVGGEASGSASGGSGPKSGSGGSKSGSGKSGAKSGKGSGSAQGSASKSGEGSKKGGANSGGKGNKNGKGSAKAGSKKKGKRIKGSASHSEKEEKEDDSGAGINPLVLLIALVLVGLLIYVMVGKKT